MSRPPGALSRARVSRCIQLLPMNAFIGWVENIRGKTEGRNLGPKKASSPWLSVSQGRSFSSYQLPQKMAAAVAPALPARGSDEAEAGPLSAAASRKLTRSLTHSPTVTKRGHIPIHSLDVEEVG